MAKDTLEGKTITIDDKVHQLSDLSENARMQIGNIQATDTEISRAKAKLAIFQTARNAYVKALKDELEKPEVH